MLRSRYFATLNVVLGREFAAFGISMVRKMKGSDPLDILIV